LLALQIEVVVLGRTAPPRVQELSWIPTDLLDADSTASAVRRAQASHLLHLAWYAEYGAFWGSRLNFEWVQATLRLLEHFCEAGGRHGVMAGSCAEYDWSHGYLREDSTPHSPHTTYGVAKDATRRLAAALCAPHGVSLAWGHIFFPFGPGEAPQRMIPSLIKVFQGQAAAFGVNTAAYRGMLYVPDAAQAFVQLLLLAENGACGNFNICSGQPVRIEHVVRTLAKLCAADPAPVLELASLRPNDPPMLVGDNTRLLATGWAPQWGLEQGLEATVQAARATSK
jgi:nucleoside-diphosphate-sugar epimerase